MRKILFIIIFLSLSLQGQTDYTAPPASVSSYFNYIDHPVSNISGTPNVSIPLLSLPASNNYSLNLSLSYHSSNIDGIPASDVGIGWSLFGSGVISRKVYYEPDEFEGTSGQQLTDIYFYSFPGGSGRFKVIKKNNSYIIIKLDPNNVKIEYTGVPKSNHYSFDTFKLTDEYGNKFFFSDYAITHMGANEIYRSAFYMTRVENANGRIIAQFQNKKYLNRVGSTKIYDEIYKIDKVILTDNGSVEFTYKTDSFPITYNDPYAIDKIIVKDVNQQTLFQYIFGYTAIGMNWQTSVRALQEVSKKDNNSQKLETTRMFYNLYNCIEECPVPERYGTYFLTGNSGASALSKYLLNKIVYPTRSSVEYKYEPNMLPTSSNYNTPEFINQIENATSLQFPSIQYLEKVDSLMLDTKGTFTYNVDFAKNNALYVKFETYEYYYPEFPPTYPQVFTPKLEIRIKKAGTNNYISTKTYDQNWSVFYAPISSPGTYIVELYGTGGTGVVEIYKMNHAPPPYKNIYPDRGVRIKQLNVREAPQEVFSEGDVVKQQNFEYHYKSDPLSSSGSIYMLDDEDCLYRNVKISDGIGNGYTWYYYKVPDDFSPAEYLEYNNLIKNGILEKTEVYKQDGTISESDTYNFTYSTIDPAYEFPYLGTTKLSYISSQKMTKKLYDSYGNHISNITELINSSDNFQPLSSKQIGADGEILETNYQYAQEKMLQRLKDANLVTSPLSVVTKRNNEVISKEETKYDDTSHIHPTSIVSYGNNNVIKSIITYDVYDVNGNVLQYTDQSGLPTAIIWGYNGTQPIAEIHGAKYADVLNVFGLNLSSDLDTLLDIVKKSNQDISSTDNTNEQLLRDALEVFRKKSVFKDYLITTYTYDPLIGVKSITSPNGFTEYYFYDNQNRIIRIEDSNHNVIKENKYNPSLN